MNASVVSFRSFLRRDRVQKPETVPGPWTNQELAELYRISDTLGRAGMPVGTDSGLSDENEPWFVFFSPETGDVIAHFARIAGVYVAAAAGQDTPKRGTCFRDLVQQILDSQPLVLPQERDRSGKVTKLYMHPAVVLAAFVATALLCSRKTMAAPDDGDEAVARRATRAGDGAATGSGASSSANNPHFDAVASIATGSAVSMGASNGFSASFASVAALITSVLQAEEAAALTGPNDDLITQAKPMHSLDADAAAETANGSQVKTSHIGHATESADSLIHVSVKTMQDSDFSPFLLNPAKTAAPTEVNFTPWLDNTVDILMAAQVSVDNPVGAAAPKSEAPQSMAAPVKQAVTDSAAPSASSSTPVEKTTTKAEAPPPAKEAAPAAQPDHFVVSIYSKDLAFITPAFLTDAEAASAKKIVSAFMKNPDADKGAKDTTADKDDLGKDGKTEASKDGSGEIPQWKIPIDALKIDGLHGVELQAGRQIVYFSGGTATVSGFVFGEDILLLDPSLLEAPWEGSIPADSGKAVFNFADGSILTLSNLVFTPYDDIA